MTTFCIIQDYSSCDGENYTREEAATIVEQIAEAMRNDASKLERMAGSIRASTDTEFEYDGAYLGLRVEPA